LAGTSWTWPSLSSTTPASRSGGTSTRAERIASIRRVPPGRSLPNWICDGGSTDSRISSPSCWPNLRFNISRAAWTCWRRSPMAIESLSSTTMSATSAIRLALLLDQLRLGQRCQHYDDGAKTPSGCHARRRAGQAAPGQADTPIAASASHGISGSKAIEAADVVFIASTSA